MNFTNLKTEKCPTCGAEPYMEGVEVEWGTDGKIMRHVNGQRWEWRQFLCGCRVGWVPNFERSEVLRGHDCRHSPEVRARELKREKAAEQLRKTVESLDVDDVFKREVLYLGRRHE